MEITKSGKEIAKSVTCPFRCNLQFYFKIQTSKRLIWPMRAYPVEWRRSIVGFVGVIASHP